jgi:hypothetical protein
METIVLPPWAIPGGRPASGGPADVWRVCRMTQREGSKRGRKSGEGLTQGTIRALISPDHQG